MKKHLCREDDGKVDEEVRQRVHQWFLEKKQTLALAESCTGGLIASYITSSPGASAYFLGSIVSYSLEAKCQFLNVSPSLLETRDAVSSSVALQMAFGVRQGFQSDWSLAITGWADSGKPPANSAKKFVAGQFFVAVCGPSFEGVRGYKVDGTRKENQKSMAMEALNFLIKSTSV